MRSDLRQLDRQLRMKREQIVFRVKAFGDTRLVSGDKNKETRVVKQLDRRLGALDPAEAAARADISVIVIEHAVTIQKRRRSPPILLFSRRSCEDLGMGRASR